MTGAAGRGPNPDLRPGENASLASTGSRPRPTHGARALTGAAVTWLVPERG